MSRVVTLMLVPILLAGLSGCDNAGTPQSNDDSARSDNATATNTAAWLLDAAPANAKPVVAAKADATEGQQIVVRGRIGGRKEPMTNDSAVFTIVDLEIPYCGQHSEHGCPTPWDYCCETPETMMANSATVQLVDGAGAALDVDPIAAGLEPLDEVVVVGTVGPRPSKEVLTIRATGVFRSGS